MNTENTISTNTFFGHPKGLFYLFFAELWERFSFYGMRALLVLYMTKKLFYSDEMSIGIYATYLSLVYVTPLIGGMLTDRVLGYRKAIVLGGVLMAFGHFFLSIEHPVFFFGALGLITVGNGFFKPNISSFVGELYSDKDKRKDAGFTIFYMGINIGGAIAPLLCAWLSEMYGWHFGFGLAGLGMLLGLFVFNRGLKKNAFKEKGEITNLTLYNKTIQGIKLGNWITVGALISVPVFAGLIFLYQYEHVFMWAISLVTLWLLVKVYRSVSRIEKDRLLVVIYATSLMTLFWSIFEQAGSSLTLFADRNVELVGMNASQTNSLNSIFIILLAVPFSILWNWLNDKEMNPRSPIKFGLGLILLGAGFLIFSSSSNSMNEIGQTPMYYLILGYFVYTVGEMFISPIGLSKMTELSAKKYLSFVMGVWFMSSFYGHFFAGKLALLTTIREGEESILSHGWLSSLIEKITGLSYDTAIEMGDRVEQLYSYVSVYGLFGLLTIAIGIIALILSPFIKKLMHGVH